MINQSKTIEQKQRQKKLISNSTSVLYLEYPMEKKTQENKRHRTRNL